LLTFDSKLKVYLLKVCSFSLAKVLNLMQHFSFKQKCCISILVSGHWLPVTGYWLPANGGLENYPGSMRNGQE